MSERPKISKLFSGEQAPEVSPRSAGLRATREAAGPETPSKTRRAPSRTTAATPTPASEPAAKAAGQNRTLTVSIDWPTWRRMRDHSTKTGEQGPSMLNSALSTPEVMAKLNSQWDLPSAIPGMKRTRRRTSDGTQQMQLRLGVEGRKYVTDLAEKAHAPSVSVFVSLAVAFYLDLQPEAEV